jgi:hypothetical protein
LTPFANESEASVAIRQPGGSERQRREKEKGIARVQTEQENSAGRLVVAHMLQQDKRPSQERFICKKHSGKYNGTAGPVAFLCDSPAPDDET